MKTQAYIVEVFLLFLVALQQRSIFRMKNSCVYILIGAHLELHQGIVFFWVKTKCIMPTPYTPSMFEFVEYIENTCQLDDYYITSAANIGFQ